jgi:hypothetical protein
VADLILIEQFRLYLVDQGVVRLWNTPVVRLWADTTDGLPQCILDPRDGAPEPGGHGYQDATVTLTKTGMTPKDPLEEFLEDAHIEVVTRAYRSPDAELIQRRIRAVVDGFKLFTMNDLVVEWVRVFSGDQPLGSDETSYTRMQTFMVRSRVRSLAGQPYWA